MRVLGTIASLSCVVVGGIIVVFLLSLREPGGPLSIPIGFIFLCLGVALLLWLVALQLMADLLFVRVIWNDLDFH